MKVSKPNNTDEVYDVMKSYCEKRGLRYTIARLKYMAEDCFLLHESRQWNGCKYWPALVMRYVLNASPKKEFIDYKKLKKEKTIKERILEQENDNAI